MKLLPAALLGVLALQACSAPVNKLVVLVDPHWPPMEFLDDTKNPAGYDIDLIKALAGEAGFSPEFRSVPWEDLFLALEQGGDVIASSVVINPARQARYGFSAPYLNAGQVLVVPKASGVHQLSDLQGRLVGVQTGTPGAEVVAKTLGYSKVFNVAAKAFEDLAAGRLAGVVVEGPMAARYTSRGSRFAGAFKIVGRPLTEENYGLVVTKGNGVVLAALNTALARVKATGVLDELAARWLR